MTIIVNLFIIKAPSPQRLLIIMAQSNPLTQVTVASSDATKYSITPVYSNRGTFSMTKQFTHKQSKPHEQDLLDLLGSMSKGARDLFLHLKSVRDYRTNIAVMGLPWNKSALSRAYTELFKLDLVKKTKVTAPVEFNNVTINFPKNSYIINPTYIMLSERYADQAQAIWDSL